MRSKMCKIDKFPQKTLLILLLTCSVNAVSNLCELQDPIKSCQCNFDGQHFVVDCARTNLNSFPASEDLTALKYLEVLDVSHNSIIKLEFKDENFESKTLRTLRASYNRIDSISEKFLHSLPHLNYVDLSHNQITQLESAVFTSVPSLHYLDLSFNDIHNLPDKLFVPMRNLRYLDLSYNNIGEQLLTFNSLNTSNLGFNDNMQTLKLDSINLTEISHVFFQHMSLTHLTLADNSLEELPILPSTLITLDLSGNYFKSIASRYLIYTQLTKLVLNRLIKLESIESYAFYNLLSLQELEIEHCQNLKTFNDKAFGLIHEQDGWNLTRISLEGNGLKQLNETYFHLFNKVDSVDLSNNPWYCDCSITWMKLVKRNLINKRNMRCVAPRKIRNREIMDLNDQLLPKCNVQANLRVQKILTSVICILVVVLLGVIMYLIYLAPYKGNRSDRYIGAQSPYSSNFVVRENELNEQL